ncbi:Proto-oncogene DBL [Myotis davidii]|uniref:Proto-oncogene DBL n=1 Tax=Myotis davidii TaxID=225400 RepID=L5LMC6_MYODS|nr:Proto-oncogene DBL [Myotis davidii]
MAEATPPRGKMRFRRNAASFPGNLHLVLVLRPTSFLQRTFTDIGFRFSQEDFMLKLPVVMLSSVSDLLTYIDDKQLTPELGGTLQYCHSEWIIFRNAIENFALTVKDMAQMLQSFGTELAETDLPEDIPSIEGILAIRAEKYHLLKNDITAVTKEGKILLTNLEVPDPEVAISSRFEHQEQISGDWQTVNKLLTQVHDMEIAFDEFWEKHQLKMEQYLQLWKFEQDFQEDLLAKVQYVILHGHRLTSNHHYALDLICQRCTELHYLSDILVNETKHKRIQLSWTFEMHKRLQQIQIQTVQLKLESIRTVFENQQAGFKNLKYEHVRPIQFEELLKYSKDCEGSEQLKVALDTMLDLLKSVNDSMHQIAINGYVGNLNELGKMIIQGAFSVWTGHKKGATKMKDFARFKPMQRHLFLYEKAIVFCKRRVESREGSGRYPSYSFKRSLKMDEVGITEYVKGDNRKFEIWYAGKEEIYIVQASNIDVKMIWLKEIRNILLKQQELLTVKQQQQRNQLTEQDQLSSQQNDERQQQAFIVPEITKSEHTSTVVGVHEATSTVQAEANAVWTEEISEGPESWSNNYFSSSYVDNGEERTLLNNKINLAVLILRYGNGGMDNHKAAEH